MVRIVISRISVIAVVLFSTLIVSAGQPNRIVGGDANGLRTHLDHGYVAVEARGGHNLGLRRDKSVATWGSSMYGESNVPSPNAGFLAVAAGANHCLGLKQDGSIVAWGSNEFNQCSVPSPNTGFVAVAAGAYHSIGIKQNGSIVAWGSNSSGQCNVPSPNTGFKAVAGGQNHSIGLKQNGSIVAWGDNTYGQCNVPPPTGSAPGNDQNNPVPSENLPPNADAGEDQIVTGSDGNGSVQVTLDGSDSADPNGSIVSYVWFEGGNQIATGVKPTVSLSVGRHIITLTVTDNTGLTDTDAIAITVETP